MKNSVLSLAALALLILAVSSCKKDPTFTEQIAGNWKSVEVKEGANDRSNSNSFNLNLHANKEFDLQISAILPITGEISQSFSGDWTSDLEKQDLTLQYGSGETKNWEVLSINETSLTVEMLENNVRIQVTFERQ